MTLPTVFKFGEFTFQAGRGLKRTNTAIPLPPRVQSLLLTLLEADGELVSYADLLTSCGGNAGISGTSLTRAIYLLRQALGKDGEVVKTSYGRGARIAVPICKSSSQQAIFASEASGEEMLRTAFELASTRTDRGLQLAAAVLADAHLRFPKLAMAPSLQADVEVSRMIRGYERPSTSAKTVLALVEKALRIEPDLPSALATKGWLTGVILDNRKEGLRLIERSRLFSPLGWIAGLYGAWLLIGERQLEEASETLEAALAISPAERGLLSLKSWLLCARGLLDEAECFIGKAIGLRPDLDLLWVVQAIINIERGDATAAQVSMSRALTLHPKDSLLLANEAWVHAVTGKHSAAVEFLAHQTKAHASYVSPVKLAMVRRALGDEIAASNLLKIAETSKDPWRLFAWCDPRLKL